MNAREEIARHVVTATVTVTAEGDYYVDADDLGVHVEMWIRAGLDDRDDLRDVQVVLAAAGQAPAPHCVTCGHGEHTGPCMVLVMHPPAAGLHGPVPCGCGQAPAPQPEKGTPESLLAAIGLPITTPSPAHQRLAAAAHDASESAHLAAMRSMRDVYRLACDWLKRDDRRTAAAEVLALLPPPLNETPGRLAAPQPETAPDACPRCGHPAAEHTRPCTVTTTWPTAAPDAEPGTPDDAERERLEDDAEIRRMHQTGYHSACGVTCQAQLPSELLRNFVLCRAYPGAGGALDELLRRERAVRDDALATAQRRTDTAEHVARQNLDHYRDAVRTAQELQRRAEAAETSVTELRRTCTDLRRQRNEAQAAGREQWERAEAAEQLLAAGRAECDQVMRTPGRDLLGQAVRNAGRRIATALDPAPGADGHDGRPA